MWPIHGLAAASEDAVADMPIALPAPSQLIDQAYDATATYPVLIAPIVQMGGIAGNISAVRTVDGALSQRTLLISTDDAPGAFDAALSQRLQDAGFDTLFSCAGNDCGPQFRLASPAYRIGAKNFDDRAGKSVYRSMKAARQGGADDRYVAYQISEHGPNLMLQFDQAQSTPHEVGEISVNAAEMGQQLDQTGRVVLYGVFFNTDSQRIKPESRDTVAQIAKLLASRADLKLLVVGHTDSQGSFDYNQALSARRAQAVVDALVDDNGVSAARLKPLGVGYAAPRASNASDVGRAKNRRVELVPW